MAEIDGVIVTPLKIIPDERGQVMHLMRADAPFFKQFGEAYISCIYAGVTKGWKIHTKSTSNMAVPIGRVKFVLHDTRDGSPTKGQFQEVYLGDNSYKLLTVPPGVAYGWKNLTGETAFVVNCATEMWAPDESKNVPIGTFAYPW